MNHSFFKSIKSKITFFTTTFILFLTLLIIFVYNYVFQANLKKSLVQSTEFNLQLIAGNISASMDNLIYLAKWSGSNLDILAYLEAPGGDAKRLSLAAFDSLRVEYNNTTTHSSSYIHRLIVSRNDDSFLQLVNSVTDSIATAPAIIEEADFFADLMGADYFKWIGIIEDPITQANKPEESLPLIPILRPIYGRHDANVVGWVYIGITTNIITDMLRNYHLPEDSHLYLTIGDQNYLLQDNFFIPLDTAFIPKETLTGISLDETTKTFLATDHEGQERTIVTRACTLDGWYLSQSISENQFSLQKQVYYMMLVFICILVAALGILLTLYINRTVNLPISRIQQKMKAIAKGDFSYDPEIEWNHELGDVGRGINTLSKDVVSLMEKRIEDEKQKKDLEYQMLQSQINPHFLYNTLNSIKWMATIQHAEGIAEMITALSRLLKSVSKGTSQLVTIADELNLLKDYFLIQQYRYGGIITIDYEIQSEALYQCKLPRFTLQPIVENALFHGIEPKSANGVIRVRVEAADNKVFIHIIDDGIGMSPELIEQVLSGDAESSTEFFKKVGVSNVHKRIQFEFGPEYGLSIESELNKYTKMTITLPFIQEET